MGKKLKILVSNDDGILAKGIISLVEALLPFGEIFVAAPNGERSAASHSLTLGTPLRAEKISFPIPVKEAFSINGTPSDCVKLALSHFLKSPPDFVVTGINCGPNLCVDVFYSGTVAGAFEGVFAGIPSIAFSLDCRNGKADFSSAKKVVSNCFKIIFSEKLSNEVVYNVNIPSLPINKIKGFRITRLGSLKYLESYELRHDPGGRPYYWLKGEPEILDKNSDCDIIAVNEGYVSITPLKPELSDFQVIEKLKSRFSKKAIFPRP